MYIDSLLVYLNSREGQGGTVVAYSSPTSEVGSLNNEQYVGKFVVAYQWSAVYNTEL